MSEQHFNRITPIVGDGLLNSRVALLGVDRGAAVAELLACSGVLDWLLLDNLPAIPNGPLTRCLGSNWAGQPAATALATALQSHHGSDLPWRFVIGQPE